jgi:hypothetical protein
MIEKMARSICEQLCVLLTRGQRGEVQEDFVGFLL